MKRPPTRGGPQIAAISRGILHGVAQACPREAFGLADDHFVLLQRSELEVKAPARGFSLILLAATLNTSLRDQGRRRGVTDSISPRLALDLHYLITPWAERAQDQHRMLGWVIEYVDQHPYLDAAVLNSLEPKAFTDHAGVQLLLSNAKLDDHLRFAELAGRALPPSVPCIARLVMS